MNIPEELKQHDGFSFDAIIVKSPSQTKTGTREWNIPSFIANAVERTILLHGWLIVTSCDFDSFVQFESAANAFGYDTRSFERDGNITLLCHRKQLIKDEDFADILTIDTPDEIVLALTKKITAWSSTIFVRPTHHLLDKSNLSATIF